MLGGADAGLRVLLSAVPVMPAKLAPPAAREGRQEGSRLGFAIRGGEIG
jgi:hypothetical protein